MQQNRRTFETRGPVDPERNYVVPRTAEIADLVQRIKNGRYIVLSAPRQTGKTTFFRWALSALVASDDNYFPIQLNFSTFSRASVSVLITQLQRRLSKAIRREWGRRGATIEVELEQFLSHYPLKDHYSFQQLMEELAAHLEYRRVAIIIDEFDGIPQAALNDFLQTL